MTTYTSDELVSTSVLSKNFWTYLQKISEKKLEKIWILRNNKIDAVIISRQEYERIIDMLEDISIYSSIQDRLSHEDFVEGEKILSKFWLSVGRREWMEVYQQAQARL